LPVTGVSLMDETPGAQKNMTTWC